MINIMSMKLPPDIKDTLGLGNYLKTKRLECGINQIEFAKKVNLSQTGLSLIESGKNDPKFTTLIRIVNTLDTLSITPIREIDFNSWKNSMDDRKQVVGKYRSDRADRIKRKPRDPNKVEIFSILAKQAWNENIRQIGPREFEFKRDIFED